MSDISADRSRIVWTVMCLVGVVIASCSAVAGAVGIGDPGGEDRPAGAAQAASSTTSATVDETGSGSPEPTAKTTKSGATAPSASAAKPENVKATATDQVTPPPGWPDVELPKETPGSVVAAFLQNVFDVDCDAADRLLTTGFKEREGTCATSRLVPKDIENYEAEVAAAKPDKSEPVVTVPATLTYAGQDFDLAFELVIDAKVWKIDAVAE